METVLKAFSIGFLLRSLFAGAFFVISYQVTGEGYRWLTDIKAGQLFAVGLPVAILAGVTIYSLHRSVLYPWIEWLFNSNRARVIREKRSLVSKETVATFKYMWACGVAKHKTLEAYARHTATWADYTHLQYTASFCIAFGSIIRRIADPAVAGRESYEANYLLWFAALGFLAAALVSDWRLHRVREVLMYTPPTPIPDRPPASEVLGRMSTS